MTEIFNRQDFLNRIGGDEVLLKEMIAGMPDHFSEVIEEMKRAVAKGDTAETERLAHLLRGISANVSAERIRETACQIETAAKDGAADMIAGMTERLEQEAERFQSLLSDMYPDSFQPHAEPEAEEKAENPAEETKNRLPELIRTLEEDFLPKWEKYTAAFFIEETEILAGELRRIATRCRLDFLIRYSEKVHRAVQQYNFSEWETLVAQFPEIMDRIRKLAQEPK